MEQTLLSVGEAAKILGISRIAVFKKIKSGKIKAVKTGRNFVIQRNDLAEALGESIGEDKKREIEKVVNRAVREYKEVFRRLGKE